MTINQVTEKGSIRIPIWIISAIIPIIMALTGFTIHQTRVQSNILNTLEYHSTQIRDLRIDIVDRATRREMDDLKATVCRIEDKMDKVILKLN